MRIRRLGANRDDVVLGTNRIEYLGDRRRLGDQADDLDAARFLDEMDDFPAKFVDAM